MIYRGIIGKNFRRLGDRMRDAREWSQAEQYYRRHLLNRPNDAAIWIQLGHASKEQGHLYEAEIQYKKGAELKPNDFDSLIHLGHVQKSLRKSEAAIETFVEAYKIHPSSELSSEIRRLEKLLRKDRVLVIEHGTIAFSVQDLFGYLQAHATMSGIQRVQAGIALNVIHDTDIDARFIINDMSEALEDGEFWMVDRQMIQKIINYASGQNVDQEQLRAMIIQAVEEALRVRPAEGCTIILLGSFWGLGNTVDRYVTAKRRGVRIGAYIYDIIPVTHPEYCDQALVQEFKMSLSELFIIVDFIITISDYTQAVLKKLLFDHVKRDIPMRTVRLAHTLTDPIRVGDPKHTMAPGIMNSPLRTSTLGDMRKKPAISKESAWPSALRNVKGHDYVAYVSTVEGRKNHIYVVKAWQEMISEGIEVPDLVFVGRKGWRIDGLLDLLDGTSNLSGRVHVVHGLSDAELNSVYACCVFTVFTSFVEGWGLPVGESLLHHRPCVASLTSSMPEVGGDFVDYIDPYNLRDGIKAFSRMICDPVYREARTQNIKNNFAPRTWAEVAKDFIDSIRDFEKLPRYDLAYVSLEQGKFSQPASTLPDRTVDFANYVRSPLRLFFHDCFYPPEAFGAWLRGSSGRLIFVTELDEGDEVIVYLDLFCVDWALNCSARIFIEDVPQGRSIKHNAIPFNRIKRQGLTRVRGKISENGICTIAFFIDGEIPDIENDNRSFCLGLRGLAFVKADNSSLRNEMIEDFIFGEIV